ncbi:MAG: exodeoxyribonuclease III [Verrucomicrobiota bacterium]
MKLISWNVNGVRSALGKGLLDFLKKSSPDVLCLQEVKATADDVTDMFWPREYHQFWNSAEKAGYAGTAIFTRVKPLKVTCGMDIPDHDKEGRVINAEFDDFILVNVYTPNSQRELLRLKYRTQEWDVAFRKHLKKLERRKPVVFCGDLNVAHQEIDLANPKSNVRNAGFTIEERESFGETLKQGYLDTFREFEKGGGHYSWWTYRMNARERNIGWRIDYFCVSEKLRPRLKGASILSEVKGSDHCPVGITLV